MSTHEQPDQNGSIPYILTGDRTVEGDAVLRGDVVYPADGSMPFHRNGYRVTVTGTLRIRP